MRETQRLGILDWGIGGVSIYKLIKQRSPPVSVTYFSDTGVTPYGKMSRRELVSRLNEVVSFLKAQGVTRLVVGCNAASTALPYLDPRGLKIEGVIDAAIKSVLKAKPARLGLIGGRRTVVSRVYPRALAESGITVRQRIAQPLSGLIESGDVSSETLRRECAGILKPISNCSHILLACTHYPAIVRILAQCVSKETRFLDPAVEIASRVARWKTSSAGPDLFLTTGDPAAMMIAAKRAFGTDVGQAERIALSRFID